MPRVTRPAFARFGFAAASLLTDWPSIAGAELARFTRPERLKWPRNMADGEADDAGAPRRRGATLILRVDGPRAVEVQFRAGQIIDRINAFFGYAAIAELRLLQAPIVEASGAAPLPPGRPAAELTLPCTEPDCDSEKSGALVAALARLGKGIVADRRGAKAATGSSGTS